ncbi:MAG: GFA family protein [Hyphomicrobiales bacterium]
MTDTGRKHFTGGCLCEAVIFEVNGTMRDIIACHCGQCRKTTGNFLAATNCAIDELTLLNERGLAWFKSSGKAERGFCKECGSVLFWRAFGGDEISISAGALNGETGLSIREHIYVADKPDWYDITDGKPQKPVWD